MKAKLYFKYALGWVLRIVVVLVSLVVARLINGAGHEFYASFMIVMALVNLAPIFERGLGYYAQNKVASIRLRNIARGTLLKIFQKWYRRSFVYYMAIIFIIIIFHDTIVEMRSIQGISDLGYMREVLIIAGFFCAFLLAGNNIIQKGMFGLGYDYIALLMQALPYIFSGLVVVLFVAFFDGLPAWLVPAYLLTFIFSLISVIIFFLVKFSKKPLLDADEYTKMCPSDEKVHSTKFLYYTLLGVVILTSETLLAGVYLDPEDLANYGILQRVYLSIILITSVINQINWSKYTKAHNDSTNLALSNLFKSLVFQVLVVVSFLALVFVYRSYWLDYFHVTTALDVYIHILFAAGVLARVMMELAATFYLATNRVLLMLTVVACQFIFIIIAILYFGDELDLYGLSLVKLFSFLVTLLLVLIFSKTRLGKIYE